MNPPNSYLGVNFTQAQKDVLANDLLKISAITNQIIDLDRQIADYNANYEYAVAQINSYCPTLSTKNTGNGHSAQKDCYDYYVNIRDTQEANRTSVQLLRNSIVASGGALELAKTQYNNDLIGIQADIKFQIQAANQGAYNENQSTANKIALQNNDPSLLIQKQKDATLLASQKQANRNKVIIFVIVAIVIIGIGWFAIKKLIG